MTTMADGLEAQDSSKSAFMEFGQQSHSQQSSPSMAASHYPIHCLHSGSHAHQHDNSPYSGSNSYNRSLPYSYMSHPHHSPYLPSYHNNAAGTQTRLDTGKRTFTFLRSLVCFQCLIRPKSSLVSAQSCLTELFATQIKSVHIERIIAQIKFSRCNCVLVFKAYLHCRVCLLSFVCFYSNETSF